MSDNASDTLRAFLIKFDVRATADRPLLKLLEDHIRANGWVHVSDEIPGRTIQYCKDGSDPQVCPESIKPDMKCRNMVSVCGSRGYRLMTIGDLIAGGKHK